MPSLRTLLLHALSVCSLCVGEIKPKERKEFSIEEVVRWLPEESVRAALLDNLAPKYRDGVFEHGKKAIEALKGLDPQLATKVVDEALQKSDLKKRDDNTTSTSLTTSTATSTTTVVNDKTSTSKSTLTSTSTATLVRTTSKTTPKSTATLVKTTSKATPTSTATLVKTTSKTTSKSAAPPPASTTGQYLPPCNKVSARSLEKASKIDGDGVLGDKTILNSTEHMKPSITLQPPRKIRTTLHVESTSGQLSSAPPVLSNERSREAITKTLSGPSVSSRPMNTPALSFDPTSLGKTAAETLLNVSSIPSIISSRSIVHTTSSSAAPTTKTGVIVSVTLTTTDSAGQTTTKVTSAFQTTAQTSTVVDETTTNDAGSTITTKKTVPAQLITTTNSAGKTITTASTLSTIHIVNGGTVLSAYTTTDKFGNTVRVSGTSAGQVITTTDAAGRTVVVTYHPGHGQVSELVQQTKTLPNGQQTTVTSFAAVGAPTQGADATAKGSPGLQTNLASPTGRYVGEMAALLGGAIGVAAML